MRFNGNRRFHRNDHRNRRPAPAEPGDPASPQSMGSEAAYMKSLIDSRAIVTVVLRDGEHLRGRIRYQDRDCFSVGPAAGGPKIFLRKGDVRYILEE